MRTRARTERRPCPRTSLLRAAALIVLLAGCAAGVIDYREADAPAFHAPDLSGGKPPRLALVLGGGGPRAFAHIGVLKVLEAQGIRPDLIVGTSSGAFVAVLSAAGSSAAEIERRALELSRSDIADYSILSGGALIGQALQDYVNRGVGQRPIEQLPVPVAIVASRRATGEAAVFNRGNAGVAVRASSAQPGSYLPVRIDGVEYVDGDLSSPVPIKVAHDLGAERIIAVDVSQNVSRAPAPTWAPLSWTEEARARRRLIEHESGLADVIIEPPLPYLVSFDVDYRRMAIATGQQAARDALPKLKALQGSLAAPRASLETASRTAGYAARLKPCAHCAIMPRSYADPPKLENRLLHASSPPYPPFSSTQ